MIQIGNLAGQACSLNALQPVPQMAASPHAGYVAHGVAAASEAITVPTPLAPLPTFTCRCFICKLALGACQQCRTCWWIIARIKLCAGRTAATSSPVAWAVLGWPSPAGWPRGAPATCSSRPSAAYARAHRPRPSALCARKAFRRACIAACCSE